MIKHAFIVTSAINTKFGVYPSSERLVQTVVTCRSIKQKIPDAKIIVMELAGAGLLKEHEEVLVRESDVFLDFTQEEDVTAIYNSTENWDVVKNATEIMCFGKAIKLLNEEGDFTSINRIHKLSGRYVINDNFDPSLYEKEEMLNKIIVSERRPSQFPIEITHQSFQYMSRLWSWPHSLTNEIIEVYDNSLQFFKSRISNNGYIDVEHCLGKFLPPAHIFEVTQIGVQGNIGPNGTAVAD